MHKVDGYVLKNFLYIFLLANIIAYIPREINLFPWLNALAFCLCLLMVFLIRATVQRYAGEFGKDREEVKNLLGDYIEDDKRGKISFHDYLKKRQAQSASAINRLSNGS